MVSLCITLNGKSSEAISLYESVFETKNKQLMRYSDAPQNPDVPVSERMKDWVIHAEMEINGTVFNFSDNEQVFEPSHFLTLMVKYTSVEKMLDAYNKLADGGTRMMEPQPQFYAKMFGWVQDKFGVDWQLLCEQ